MHRITHVGIVASPTQMINAPDVGLLVRLDSPTTQLQRFARE
jgi:hypothetical protein